MIVRDRCYTSSSAHRLPYTLVFLIFYIYSLNVIIQAQMSYHITVTITIMRQSAQPGQIDYPVSQYLYMFFIFHIDNLTVIQCKTNMSFKNIYIFQILDFGRKLVP